MVHHVLECPGTPRGDDATAVPPPIPAAPAAIYKDMRASRFQHSHLAEDPETRTAENMLKVIVALVVLWAVLAPEASSNAVSV